MSMILNESPVAIPYPGVNATGTVKFQEVLTTSMTNMSNRNPQGFSGAYLFYKNDTDSGLMIVYPTSGHQCFLTPGDVHSCPIPQADSTMQWTVIYQNPYKVHPAEALNIQFYDKSDIDAGHQLIASSLANPSTPAAAIGPGTLPAGVLEPANQVSAGTFGAGVLEPGSQVTGDIAANQVGPGTMDSDVIAASANTLNGGANLPGGTLGQSADGDIIDAANNHPQDVYIKVRGVTAPVLHFQLPNGVDAAAIGGKSTPTGMVAGGHFAVDNVNCTSIFLVNGAMSGINAGIQGVGAGLSVVINHGLGGTPRAIMAVTRNGLNSGTCGCDTYTTTQFTLFNGAGATLNYQWTGWR